MNIPAITVATRITELATAIAIPIFFIYCSTCGFLFALFFLGGIVYPRVQLASASAAMPAS
jgi:hypothetical protein